MFVPKVYIFIKRIHKVSRPSPCPTVSSDSFINLHSLMTTNNLKPSMKRKSRNVFFQEDSSRTESVVAEVTASTGFQFDATNVARLHHRISWQFFFFFYNESGQIRTVDSALNFCRGLLFPTIWWVQFTAGGLQTSQLVARRTELNLFLHTFHHFSRFLNKITKSYQLVFLLQLWGDDDKINKFKRL